MIEASPSKLLTDKASYQSWPVIARTPDNTLVVAYASGAAVHPAEDDARGVYVIRSLDDGISWTTPVLVVNSPTADESTYGIGVTAAGLVLLWVRVVSAGAYSNVLYASSTNGLTWGVHATPTFATEPVLVNNIVSCDGILYAPYHSGPESGELQRSWGHLRSTDDGATWTQLELGTAIDDSTWPVEPRYHVAEDDTRILAIARNLIAGQPLWQYTSSDGGNTWTTATATNITDQNNTPTALVGPDDDLMAIYFDRTNGLMRARATTFDDAYANPSNWPPSTVVAYGTTWFGDNGYPHAVPLPDGALCVWYSGMYNYPGIMAFTVRSTGTVKPRPVRVVDRISANPAGILTPHPGDISWDIPITATSATLVGYGLTVLADEAWASGRVFWRLLAGGLVANSADLLTVSAHYYRDSGARANPVNMELTFNSVANTVKDTGWQPLPFDFGHVSAAFWMSRYRVDIRARLRTGATGPARVYANTSLLLGVA